jgi:multidrug efflux pump subunit AcrB
MYDESLQTSVERLKNLVIFRDGDQNVTLDMVADMTVKPRLSQIQRSSRQTSLSIGGNLEEEVTIDEAREKIQSILQNIELPSGYSWSLEGSFQRQDEDESIMLTNMLLAVVMIYIVMAALFESLVNLADLLYYRCILGFSNHWKFNDSNGHDWHVDPDGHCG